jgi:uncharacterized protein (TIGR00725 family)
MKFRIGVMGSSQGPLIENQETIAKSIQLGHYIAKADCILVNGACPGLPDEAAYGAHKAGGFVLGISPAFSEKEHMETYKSPIEYYDAILFTAQGLMDRDIINIRSSDAVILLGGGIGTLNEFTVAYDEGKVVGVLKGSGGVSDNIPEIVEICKREMSDNVIIESDPKVLVEKVLEALKSHPTPTVQDERVVTSEGKIYQKSDKTA